MASYTHEFSKFPESIMSITQYKDVTDAVAEILNQIKSYQAAGNYIAAAKLIAENPSIKQYIVDASFFNAIIEEQRNCEIYAKTAKQSIYAGSEPPAPIHNDVWIGDDLI